MHFWAAYMGTIKNTASPPRARVKLTNSASERVRREKYFSLRDLLYAMVTGDMEKAIESCQLWNKLIRAV